jgi:hypothetical protein
MHKEVEQTRLRKILFKFSSPFNRKTKMLHQDNFSHEIEYPQDNKPMQDKPSEANQKSGSEFKPMQDNKGKELEETISKLVSFCQNEVAEKRLSQEHFALFSLVIGAFLSQSGEKTGGK